MELTREILNGLGQAFPDDEVEFLPRATSNGKALGLPYIDARDVMRRLDAVVGPDGWSFDFDVLAADGKQVKGKLTVLGVTKCDAGEAHAEDEPLKSAVSDAVKRCAVHFGVGRYLYYLPKIWAPYDAQKRCWSEQPRFAPTAIQRALTICGVSPAVRLEVGRNSGSERTRAAVERTERPLTGQVAGDRPPESSGDAHANRPTPAPLNGVRDAAALQCTGPDCVKPLTRGQHDMSIRSFGVPLCPYCQKERGRAAAA